MVINITLINKIVHVFTSSYNVGTKNFIRHELMIFAVFVDEVTVIGLFLVILIPSE